MSTTLSPAAGSAQGGATIRLRVSGASFDAAPTLSIGGSQVPSTRVDDTQLDFTLPRYPKGNYADTVTVSFSSSRFRGEATFAYQQYAPSLTSASPAQARVGEVVTLTGAGFVSGIRVRFGGVEATQVDFLNENTLAVVVPQGVAYGANDLTVMLPASGLASPPLRGSLEVLAPPAPPPFTLSGSVSTPIASGVSFPIEVTLREHGAISPVSTEVSLTVLDGATPVFGPSTVSTVGGKATWSVTLGPQKTYQARVTGSWQGGGSTLDLGSFEIVPEYRFTQAPTDPPAGNLSAIKVSRWGIGGPNTSAAGDVTLRLFGNVGGSLGGTLTQPLVNGVATFPDLSLTKAAPSYCLRARFSETGAEVDQALKVVPGAAAVLSFLSGTPTRREATAPLSPFLEVAVLDAHGNLVRGYSGDVALALDAHASGATLGGTSPRPVVQGVAHFDDITLSAAGTALTLRATSTGLTLATLALDVTGPPLDFVSVTASDGANAADGIDSDDTVTIVFNQPTNKPVLTAANIDQALPVFDWAYADDLVSNPENDFAVQRTWKSGDGSLGGALWSADGRTLTVTFATAGGAPSVAAGDRILIRSPLTAATGGSGSEARAFVLGRLGSALRLANVEGYVQTVGKEIILRGQNFSPVAADNTVRVGGTVSTVLDATSNQLRVRIGSSLGGTNVSTGGSTSNSHFGYANGYLATNTVSSDIPTPRAPRLVSTSRDSVFVAFVRQDRSVVVWTRRSTAQQVFMPTGSTSNVDIGPNGWFACATEGSPGSGLASDAIYVSKWVNNSSINPDKELVSKETAGGALGFACRSPSISEGGRYVVFEADGLPAGVESSVTGPYVLVRDRDAATLTVVSVDPGGNVLGGSDPEITADGRFVVFLSKDRLVGTDSNDRQDAYLWDRTSGQLHWLSSDAAAGALSSRAMLAEDGRYATYARGGDVYLLDRAAGAASVKVTQAEEPTLSSNGRYLAFVSARNDLLVGWPSPDNNGREDAFRMDLEDSSILPLSTRWDGVFAARDIDQLGLSADGAYGFVRSRNETSVRLVSPAR